MAETKIKKIIGRVYPLKRLAFFSQRLLMNPRCRELLSDLACKRLPSKSLPVIPYEDDAASLHEAGYAMLDNLVRESEVKEMVDWFSDKKTFDRWDADAGYFDPERPPADCHTAPFSTEDIVNSPHAMKWVNDERVLKVVESILGAKPTLSNLSVWWSYPGHDAPQEAESFHRDVDDLRFIKLFIYLTDVSSGSGPHVFVPGSHRNPAFRKIRRYTDEEVETSFGKDGIKYFTGTRGTAFLENTFGLHKGQLPSIERRLLFQAQYSLHPIGIYDYSPVKLNSSKILDLDGYVNRLYVK